MLVVGEGRYHYETLNWPLMGGSSVKCILQPVKVSPNCNGADFGDLELY
jgi:hypothetical protein